MGKAKDISFLDWVEEALPADFSRKHMFGGYAYYYESRLILVIFESPGEKTYKGRRADFDLWDGCLFPAEREHHEAIKKLFPMLVNHPVLGKWLYLPQQTEDFEEVATRVIRQLLRRADLFGVYPKSKKPKTTRKEPIEAWKPTPIPSMFSDEPAEQRIQRAKKISDLLNLGPVSEKEFHKAGIKTVSQFVKLGWKKTMVKLVKANRRNRHAVFAYAVIGALQNIEWNAISAADKEQARELMKSLKSK